MKEFLLKAIYAGRIALLLPAPADACRLTLPPSMMSSPARVASVELTVPHAAVSGWHMVPIGWSLEIENDPSWRAHLAARAIVGAAFLDPAAFGTITLQPQPGFSCEVMARSGPRIRLTFYEADRLWPREAKAVITGE